ncbi:hypothetical protein IQ13_0249 [Lacibacter cauensis]|uniref:Uncharacterized protein n=1 Tax=Lacibacter cauensis TaxID=510947 RepID=A0A562SVQ0_9BACT|nr:hypothetical protein [Lacibacter cauensis]TWI85094.1 hypothetical protein IQ13_0249 [Lacibacter cauensis]
MKPLLTLVTILFLFLQSQAQEVTDTTIQHPATDTVLRIRNLNPYFTVHVDSSLSYKLEINKEQKNYYWYLKNSPVGLRINKDNGTLTFKAEKAYFLSGRLKYDVEYKVQLGVQSLDNPADKTDTLFTIVFFNTEIIQSKIRPSVSASITVDEGDTARISLNCENGNFPIEYINFESSLPIKPEYQISKCKDEFVWFVPYDFVKDNDSGKVKVVRLLFVGADKFRNKDTAVVRVVVRDAINYPLKKQEYDKLVTDYNRYIIQLKFTFRTLDRKIKKTRNSRVAFDMTSSSSALAGTILSTSKNEEQKNVGRVLPAVGVTLVPVKEAVSPNKVNDQNSVSLVRTSIRRLEYILQENGLLSEKDPDIVAKTAKMKADLKQIQQQLIDVPLDEINIDDPKEAAKYFESKKVNRKYRSRKN